MQARFQERAFLFQKIGFELAVDLQMCLRLFFFLRDFKLYSFSICYTGSLQCLYGIKEESSPFYGGMFAPSQFMYKYVGIVMKTSFSRLYLIFRKHFTVICSLFRSGM